MKICQVEFVAVVHPHCHINTSCSSLAGSTGHRSIEIIRINGIRYNYRSLREPIGIRTRWRRGLNALAVCSAVAMRAGVAAHGGMISTMTEVGNTVAREVGAAVRLALRIKSVLYVAFITRHAITVGMTVSTILADLWRSRGRDRYRRSNRGRICRRSGGKVRWIHTLPQGSSRLNALAVCSTVALRAGVAAHGRRVRAMPVVGNTVAC